MGWSAKESPSRQHHRTRRAAAQKANAEEAVNKQTDEKLVANDEDVKQANETDSTA